MIALGIGLPAFYTIFGQVFTLPFFIESFVRKHAHYTCFPAKRRSSMFQVHGDDDDNDDVCTNMLASFVEPFINIYMCEKGAFCVVCANVLYYKFMWIV